MKPGNSVSEDRLKLQNNGDIVLRLKTKYSDGTSHLLFSGLEFVEKLAALVPQPRIHLTRFFGCLAPNAKIRSQVVPKQEAQVSTQAVDIEPESGKSKNRTWASLLARTFGIDTRHCQDCGGDLKLVAAIMETTAIRKILGHLGIPDTPPAITPSTIVYQLSF